MAKKKIFGYTREEIRKQCKDYAVDPAFNSQPIIITGSNLEPCLNGCKTISEKPELFSRVRHALTRC